MKVLTKKSGYINKDNLAKLTMLWEKQPHGRAFFTHPLNLVIFFPNTEICFKEHKSYVEITALDSFTQYMPCLPYGIPPWENTSAPIYNIPLNRIAELPKGKKINLYDWHYNYSTKALKRAFKKRRNLINTALKSGITVNYDLPPFSEIQNLIRIWANEKKTASIEEQIILESNIEIQERFYSYCIDILKSIGIQTITVGIYKHDRLLGLSTSLFIYGGLINLFEISFQSEGNFLPTFTFYNTYCMADKLNAKYINTLGHDNIPGLIYNKELYRPFYITPIYRMEAGY